MRAIISVIGKDKTGIIAKVSHVLYETNANILDISQTIMQDMFTMVMLTDISKINIEFSSLKSALANVGEEMNVDIRVQHEDLFNSMHRI